MTHGLTLPPLLTPPSALVLPSLSSQDGPAYPRRPIRRPPDHDARITLAVDESLAILETFKPSDPSQRLLLIPCLVVGTACFSPRPSKPASAPPSAPCAATRASANTDRVAELLEEVWRPNGPRRLGPSLGLAGASPASSACDFLCC